MSTCNFTVSKVVEGLGIRQTIPITVGLHNSGGKPSSPFFYKNPQYIIKATSGTPGVNQAAVRISYQGPAESYVLATLTQPKHNSRVLYLTNEIQPVKSEDALKYRPQFSCVEAQIYVNTPYTVIFSNYEYEDMLGEYKAIFESDVPLAIEEIKPEGYGLNEYSIDVIFGLIMIADDILRELGKEQHVAAE